MQNNFFAQLASFMQNPVAFLASRRINIPQHYMSSPKAAVEYLMSTGKMSQQQFNELYGRANQIMQDPAFKQQ